MFLFSGSSQLKVPIWGQFIGQFWVLIIALWEIIQWINPLFYIDAR